MAESVPEATTSYGNTVLEGANWIVRFAASREVESEDIPDEIVELMPQICRFAEIMVEGVDAPPCILRRVCAGCKIVAKKAGSMSGGCSNDG